ncbi:BolA-like protein 3 [Coemansia sp. Benny D115]|nr:BolA-like protein 3 [Coemansia sp. Benny D115]
MSYGERLPSRLRRLPTLAAARALSRASPVPGSRTPAGALAAALRRAYSARPSFETSGEEQIFNKLQQLSPTKLVVRDASGGCGSMYVVEIEAECFRGKTRVNQTKMVNSLLKDELKEMHGMRVLCSTPPIEPSGDSTA